MYQHDPRHVDVLVKDLGLEHGNSVQKPATHDVTLEQIQHTADTGCKLQGVCFSVKMEQI